MTQSLKRQALNVGDVKSILDCWQNGEYINFFIEYLQQHVYIKSKHIVKDYFKKIEHVAIRINEFHRSFLTRQSRFIKHALDMGYIEFYNHVTYKHTKKVHDPGPLIKELKKIKFKASIPILLKY